MQRPAPRSRDAGQQLPQQHADAPRGRVRWQRRAALDAPERARVRRGGQPERVQPRRQALHTPGACGSANACFPVSFRRRPPRLPTREDGGAAYSGCIAGPWTLSTSAARCLGPSGKDATCERSRSWKHQARGTTACSGSATLVGGVARGAGAGGASAVTPPSSPRESRPRLRFLAHQSASASGLALLQTWES